MDLLLEINIRDVKKKGKTLRNKGIITGTLKRVNGEKYNIQLLGNDLDTIIARSNLNLTLQVKFQGEVINTKIERVQKDVLFHNIINADLYELK